MSKSQDSKKRDDKKKPVKTMKEKKQAKRDKKAKKDGLGIPTSKWFSCKYPWIHSVAQPAKAESFDSQKF